MLGLCRSCLYFLNLAMFQKNKGKNDTVPTFFYVEVWDIGKFLNFCFLLHKNIYTFVFYYINFLKKQKTVGTLSFMLWFEFDNVSKTHGFFKHSQIQKNQGKDNRAPTFFYVKFLDRQACYILSIIKSWH